MTVIRSLLIVTGLVILGAIIGALLGYLAGMAYVILAGVSNIEGQSGITVFYEFVPVGILQGMVSMSIIFTIWRRTRNARGSAWMGGLMSGCGEEHDHSASKLHGSI